MLKASQSGFLIGLCQDPLFWICVTIGHHARKPLDHVLFWFQKPSTFEELESAGDKLAQLQSGKSAEFVRGFERTLTEFDWEGVIAAQPQDLQAVAHELALDLLLNGAGNYHRRMQKPLDRQASANFITARSLHLV